MEKIEGGGHIERSGGRRGRENVSDKSRKIQGDTRQKNLWQALLISN